MKWIINLFKPKKKEHHHDWVFDFNMKNASAYYCNNCPQLSVICEGKRTLTNPIETAYDNNGKYNGTKKRNR